MNPKRVPVEVLEGIFAYIDDKRTMYNLLLTCKLFSSLITPSLYRQVPMVDDDPRKVPDEPVISTLQRRLTKLLESLTPTKAGHIKLLALDPFIQSNAFDIFSHFTNLESLVLYFPYNYKYKGDVQLHPQFLKVKNLAIRIVTHSVERSDHSRHSFGDNLSAVDYLESLWRKWDKDADNTKSPPELHIIFDTCVGTAAPDWARGDLASSGVLLDFTSVTATRRVHTNAAPTQDWSPHHFDQSLFLGFIFHYYPTSYWNSGRATTKLWDSPDCRNEGYELRHWVACCLENFEEDWCRGPLPDDYFRQFLPPGWTGEEPVFHFHATHKILLDLFRPPPYFISNGAFHQALGGVDNAIRLLSRTPTSGILFNLEYPIFRRELSEPELNKMYIEIRELLVPPTENETEGSYDCIDESWMAVLKETFVPLTQELWVNTCPEIYDSQFKLITSRKSHQWTALYDFLAYLVKQEPNWALRTVGNLGPIFNLSRSPETVKQLPPNSYTHLIDARCLEPLSALSSLTTLDFDMDYFSLDPSNSFGSFTSGDVEYGAHIAQLSWIKKCSNLQTLILRNLTATTQNDRLFLFRLPCNFQSLSWTWTGRIFFSSDSVMELFGSTSIEDLLEEQILWKWLDAMRERAAGTELKLNFVRVKAMVI